MDSNDVKQGKTNNVPAADWVPDIKPKPLKERSQMGRVEIVLDEGIIVTAYGEVFGLEHQISGIDFEAELFLDHFNQRVKVSSYEGPDLEKMVNKIHWLAEKNNFDKIIVMASENDWRQFLSHGYVLEAVLKYYLKGEHAYIVSRFRSQERLTSMSLMSEIELIEKILLAPPSTEVHPTPIASLEGIEMRLAVLDDIPKLIELYREIFETYPSPLLHEDFMRSVFQKHSLFGVALNSKGEIIAAASAELNRTQKAAEITDCATRKDQRGKGLMSTLINLLEEELRKKNYICAYTMARGRSYGMNNVFHRLNYEFMGRLINNCDIYGCYEDMNIWVKRLV